MNKYFSLLRKEKLLHHKNRVKIFQLLICETTSFLNLNKLSTITDIIKHKIKFCYYLKQFSTSSLESIFLTRFKYSVNLGLFSAEQISTAYM